MAAVWISISGAVIGNGDEGGIAVVCARPSTICNSSDNTVTVEPNGWLWFECRTVSGQPIRTTATWHDSEGLILNRSVCPPRIVVSCSIRGQLDDTLILRNITYASARTITCSTLESTSPPFDIKVAGQSWQHSTAMPSATGSYPSSHVVLATMGRDSTQSTSHNLVRTWNSWRTTSTTAADRLITHVQPATRSALERNDTLSRDVGLGVGTSLIIIVVLSIVAVHRWKRHTKLRIGNRHPRDPSGSGEPTPIALVETPQLSNLQQGLEDLKTEMTNNRVANRQQGQAILRQGQEVMAVCTDLTDVVAAKTDQPALQSRVSDDSSHDTNRSSDVEAGVVEGTTPPDSEHNALSTSKNVPATPVPGVRSSASDSVHNVQQSTTAV